MSSQFVAGWTLHQIIGSGTYGNVHLTIHNETGTAVAVKMMKIEDQVRFSLYPFYYFCITIDANNY